MASMKLGVAYNVFDGEELLYPSIRSVRPAVDHICIVYQTTSNFGESNAHLERVLQELVRLFPCDDGPEAPSGPRARSESESEPGPCPRSRPGGPGPRSASGSDPHAESGPDGHSRPRTQTQSESGSESPPRPQLGSRANIQARPDSESDPSSRVQPRSGSPAPTQIPTPPGRRRVPIQLVKYEPKPLSNEEKASLLSPNAPPEEYGGSVNGIAEQFFHEVKKREIGRLNLQANGCTHFITMDVDEFYHWPELEAVKRLMLDEDLDATACKMRYFFKEPIYELLPFDEENRVPLLCRLGDDLPLRLAAPFPVLVDPTRRADKRRIQRSTVVGVSPSIPKPNDMIGPGAFPEASAGTSDVPIMTSPAAGVVTSSPIVGDSRLRFRDLGRDVIQMYHMSFVRADIRSKLRNVSNRQNYTCARDPDAFARRFDTWRPEDGVLHPHPFWASRFTHVTVVPNWFNVDILTICATCRCRTNVKRCSRCRQTYYCGRECQVAHYLVHKKVCKPFQDKSVSCLVQTNASARGVP